MVLPILLALAAPTSLQWLEPGSVQPGQRGICVTEWGNGERIELPVEVLGLLDAAAPERASILVRFTDERLAGSGVVAGMSGSPVYVDGKLLGAVAFGFPFARDPMAGVTPFAQMRAIATGSDSAAPLSFPLTALAALAARQTPPAQVLSTLAVARPGGPLPVAVGGLPASAGLAREVLAAAGLEAVPAGGGAEVDGIPEAGDMIAALLVWGDAVVAAGGTVTAREGNTLWAFGHPLLSLGAVRLPAARARVVAVQDSYQLPFKLFSVGRPFGTFLADRPAGVLAVAGDPSTGVPVRVGVANGEERREWAFRVAEVPTLEPLLLAYLVQASLTARGAAVGDASVRTQLEMTFADGRRVTLVHAARGADALAQAAVFAAAACAVFVSSPFVHPALAAVDVRLSRWEQPLGATIVEALPARTVVAPGDTLPVAVRLQPYRAPAVVRSFSVQIPRDALAGSLDLLVADGAAFSDYRLKAEGVEPADFAGLLTEAARLEGSTTLLLALESREGGVAYPGVSQPGLPPSWAATLATGLGRRPPQRLKTAIVATARWTAPYPLEGAFRIPLTVRRSLEQP